MAIVVSTWIGRQRRIVGRDVTSPYAGHRQVRVGEVPDEAPRSRGLHADARGRTVERHVIDGHARDTALRDVDR